MRKYYWGLFQISINTKYIYKCVWVVNVDNYLDVFITCMLQKQMYGQYLIV